jgi:hypothetical protein
MTFLCNFAKTYFLSKNISRTTIIGTIWAFFISRTYLPFLQQVANDANYQSLFSQVFSMFFISQNSCFCFHSFQHKKKVLTTRHISTKSILNLCQVKIINWTVKNTTLKQQKERMTEAAFLVLYGQYFFSNKVCQLSTVKRRLVYECQSGDREMQI